MDVSELAQCLEVTASDSSTTTATSHTRLSQYKINKGTDQETRRERFLREQKLKRYNFVLHARRIASGKFDESDSEDEVESDENESMDWTSIKKPSKSYKNQLMLSEWMIEKPKDFQEKWLMMLCPRGKRNLIIAANGYTKVYSRNGFLITKFSSNLPGGTQGSRGYTILDCVYSVSNNTYYILDTMCWNAHPIYDSETEFRFYWLKAKLEECPEVSEISACNPSRFIQLSYFPCDSKSIQDAFKLWDGPKLDGVLFYHKELHYIPGVTPLIGWLKPYMIKEVVGVEIDSKFENSKPVDYKGIQQHLNAKKSEKMDCDIEGTKS